VQSDDNQKLICDHIQNQKTNIKTKKPFWHKKRKNILNIPKKYEKTKRCHTLQLESRKYSKQLQKMKNILQKHQKTVKNSSK
jgi:hypothetical protein